MKEYTPDELLPLSGIQHFCFCRRQWALIHVEQQWQENLFTVEGKLIHQRADDPFFSEVRKGVITARSLPIASYSLGLSGHCDIVEFWPDPEGIELKGRTGFYKPIPVEYKRGQVKENPSDEAQICAQAICLEEMLSTQVQNGFIYYGQTHHRVQIGINNELRSLVIKMCEEMHSYFNRGYTPKVKPSKACRSCSLKYICLPELNTSKTSASEYIRARIEQI